MMPTGTADRCCFVCGRSSTNPHLLETNESWRYQEARPDGLVSCLWFTASTLIRGFNVCGAFVSRADFAGWPGLPPSIHPADRHRDG